VCFSGDADGAQRDQERSRGRGDVYKRLKSLSAKCCTPQSCGFRDHFADLRASGATAVYGLSVQDTAYQAEAAARLHLPFPLLSDEGLTLQRALNLPTFEAAGMVLLTRMALVITDGVVEAVFHPVTDPARNAEDVLAYLKGRSS